MLESPSIQQKVNLERKLTFLPYLPKAIIEIMHVINTYSFVDFFSETTKRSTVKFLDDP
jgi:hypothetical protein